MISETLGRAGGKGRRSGTSASVKIAVPVQMRLYRGALWSSVQLSGYVWSHVLAYIAHVGVQLVGPLLFAYASAYASPVWIAPHLRSTGVSHPHGTRVPSAGLTVTNRGWPHHPLPDCMDPPSRWHPVPVGIPSPATCGLRCCSLSHGQSVHVSACSQSTGKLYSSLTVRLVQCITRSCYLTPGP